MVVLPTFMQYDVSWDSSAYSCKLHPSFNNRAYTYYYGGVTLNSITYAVPVAVLLFLNGNIVWRHRAVKKKKTTAGVSPSPTSIREELTKAFVVVVILYMICQVPSPAHRLLRGSLPEHQRQCRG